MNSDYSSSAPSATLMAGMRILVMLLGPVAISKGWVGAGDIENVAVGVLTAGTAIFGLFKTFKRQKKINVAELTLGPILK